jgi:hypothetical protein
MFLTSPQGFFKMSSAQRFVKLGSQHSQLQELGFLMAEMARRLRAGTSVIELAIKRKNSEEDQ